MDRLSVNQSEPIKNPQFIDGTIISHQPNEFRSKVTDQKTCCTYPDCDILVGSWPLTEVNQFSTESCWHSFVHLDTSLQQVLGKLFIFLIQAIVNS